MAFLFILGQALPGHLVGGCGAWAVSRKKPIYFICIYFRCFKIKDFVILKSFFQIFLKELSMISKSITNYMVQGFRDP